MITIEPPSSGRSQSGDPKHPKPNATSLDKTTLRRFLQRAQSAVGLTGEVHVLLTDDAALRRLNRLFRGKDKATDVLSFPASREATGMAGDLAISLDHAQQQASAFGHTLVEEVKILLLHGLLHLAGEDHETDSGQMAAREATLRAKLRIPVGLIERVQIKHPKPRPVARVSPLQKQSVRRQRA